MNPIISIIVPVYNIAEYIPNCLNSLLRQTYSNLEILVVNDGSTDNSWDIIQGYAEKDNRIIAINQPNGGVAKARNCALDKATGDFLTFVDGDDMLAPETLNLLLKKFEDEQLDWIEFPVERVDANGNKLAKVKDYLNFYPKKEYIIAEDEFVEYLSAHKLSELACACLYRRSSVVNLRFNEEHYYEDSFYFTDVITTTRKGAIFPFGKYLYVQRENSAQLTTLTKERLLSKVACFWDRKKKIQTKFSLHDKWFRKQESELYYYLKIQKAKKIEGAEDILNLFRSKIQTNIVLDFKKEIQICIYTWIGYKNTIKWFSFFCRHYR